MKTRMQKFGESHLFIAVTAVLYLALTGFLFSVMGMQSKGEIEILLTQWVSRFLWVNFLLIAIGIALCRRDIAAAFRGLFTTSPHPGPLPQGEREMVMNLPQGERETGMNLPEGEKGSNSPYGEMKVARGNSIQVSPPLAGGDEGEGVVISRLRNLNRPGVYLLLILIAGILLVTLVAPQVHRIYYDEDIYANMAQNIANTGQTGMANYGTFEYGEYFVNWLLYNKDPSGWPFLISLVFQLFGTDETYAFYLNNLLFAGGILVVFFIARIIAGGWFAGLLAALTYAIVPHNLIWSNTIAAENPAAFFGGLAVLCTLVWLRTREMRHLFLMMTVLPFACTMRPESAMIGMWALAAAAVNLFSAASPHPGPLPQGEREMGMNLRQGEREEIGMGLPRGERGTEGALPQRVRVARGHAPSEEAGMNPPHPFATRAFWAMGLVSFALIIPLIWHFYAMSGQSWGAEGAKFSGVFFPKNLEVNGFYYLENKAFPILITLLAMVGIAAGKSRSERAGEKTGRFPVLMIGLWFLLFWGIFLFFYAGSYKYGADVRFALVSFMPLAVLAGIGADILRKKVGELSAGRRKSAIVCEGAAAAGDKSGRLRTAPGQLPVVTLLILVLMISWMKFLPLIRLVGQEAWGARYDHAYAREFIKKIPNRAIVLTHIPTMFLLWGQNAIQTYAGINNPDIIRDLMNRYGGHVYFHQNYWCNTLNDANRAVCDGIRQRYNLDPVVVATEQRNEYGLYRMTFK